MDYEADIRLNVLSVGIGENTRAIEAEKRPYHADSIFGDFKFSMAPSHVRVKVLKLPSSGSEGLKSARLNVLIDALLSR